MLVSVKTAGWVHEEMIIPWGCFKIYIIEKQFLKSTQLSITWTYSFPDFNFILLHLLSFGLAIPPDLVLLVLFSLPLT
jgi:hypothetical protein